MMKFKESPHNKWILTIYTREHGFDKIETWISDAFDYHERLVFININLKHSFMEVAFLNCGYVQEFLGKHCHTKFFKKGLVFYQVSMLACIHNVFLSLNSKAGLLMGYKTMHVFTLPFIG